MLAVKTLILPDTYRDSVFLMKLSSQAREESGAEQVSAMMGTARNKELFTRSGLVTSEMEAARADDLVIAVRAEENMLEKALDCVRLMLDKAPARAAKGACGAEAPQSLPQLLAAEKDMGLALISVAGDYARYEAAVALNAGLDVMLYSDNISLEDELALKKLAAKKSLLVMGPDCGTAIIDGVPLAFANAARRGPVGLVGASGTGLQEVICLLDRLGVGISQAYGTGGRDMKDAIGGITTMLALDRLLEDPATRFIGILGKPPGSATRAALLDRIRKSSKPVTVHYLGATDYAAEEAANVPHARDLTLFASKLARQADATVDPAAILGELPPPPPLTQGGAAYVRGLFSGGTLCQEAAELAAPLLGKDMYSNLSIAGFTRLSAADASRGHAFWDFGEDEFTVGRPHPMMAPELRMERVVRELCDPDVGVVLLDMVIGFGAAANQAESLAAALEEAERKSGGKSREKLVVASVCGTEGDAPRHSAQVNVLRANGVTVLGSNAQAAVWAAQCARGGR